MKLHKRYIYLVIAVFSAVGFLWATQGHLFRLRMETLKFCRQMDALFCSPGHKVMVDIMEEHRAGIMDIFVLLFGISIIAFIYAWFKEIKKNNLVHEQIPKKNKSKKDTKKDSSEAQLDTKVK